MFDFDIIHVVTQILFYAFPVLIAITFHEFSHGFIAYKLGDPTAKNMGRLTLNPLAHIDLFGTIIMPLLLLILTKGQFVFGYAKPIPINPLNFKDPKKGMALSAAAGPVTNILLAAASFILIKYAVTPLVSLAPYDIALRILMPLSKMLVISITLNIVLAVFNMIPIPPLDGGRVLTGFLPYKQAVALSRIEPFGMLIVIILITSGIADYFMIPLMNFFLNILQML